MYIKSNDIKPFEKKLWLSSPTMHGEEQKWVDEAIRTTEFMISCTSWNLMM